MIREKFNPVWLEKILGRAFSSLSPDTYTFLSLSFASLGIIFSYFRLHSPALLAFVFSGLLDIVDGAVAKYTYQTSAKGAFIDGVADRFSDFFLIISFIFFGPLSVFLVSSLLYFYLLPTFIIAYANHRSFVHDPDEVKVWRIMHRGKMYLALLICFAFISYAQIGLTIVLVLNIITTMHVIFLCFKHKTY